MKKLFLDLTFAALCAALLSACGGDSSSKADPSDEIVAESMDDLPNCTKNREGVRAITDEGNYVCTDGAWEEEAPEIPSFETEEDLPNCSRKKEGMVAYVEDLEDTLVCKSGEWWSASDVEDGDDRDDDDSGDDEDGGEEDGTDEDGESSTSEDGKSSSSVKPAYDISVVTEDDLPECTAKREGTVVYVEETDLLAVCESGLWQVMDTDEGTSSDSSEDIESSGSGEGSSASVSREMVSCDIPGVMGECMEYPVGSDEAAQLTEFCVSMLGGTLGTGCAASTSDASIYDADKNTLKDLRDGQIYKTTTIEVPSKNYSEVWMAENLNLETEFSSCYNDYAENCEKNGRLYTWGAAMDSAGVWSTDGKGCGRHEKYGTVCSATYPVRGVCPEGWHLPTQAEWKALFTAVGDSSTVGKMLKSISGWNDSGNGTDSYAFSALPAGYWDGYYTYEGSAAFFWSSTEHNGYYAYYMYLGYYFDHAGLDDHRKDDRFSVRCIKD